MGDSYTADGRYGEGGRPTGTGRLPVTTNGCFVDAKHEKPALSVGQLWRSAVDGYGSASDSSVSDLTVGKLTAELSDRTPAPRVVAGDPHQMESRIDAPPRNTGAIDNRGAPAS